ncbi:hypothetical protein [Thermus sediminis]|nr:hypothetical protein [Thermus sediminis]
MAKEAQEEEHRGPEDVLVEPGLLLHRRVEKQGLCHRASLDQRRWA